MIYKYQYNLSDPRLGAQVIEMGADAKVLSCAFQTSPTTGVVRLVFWARVTPDTGTKKVRVYYAFTGEDGAGEPFRYLNSLTDVGGNTWHIFVDDTMEND